MQLQFADLFAIAAAAASLYAAQSKTMIPLRAAAVAANLSAMIYYTMQGAYPMLSLNAALLVLNAWRLHAMLKLVRDIAAATKSDMNVAWLLPYTRPKKFKAGHILMQRGDYATAAFYLVSGEVAVVEIDQTFGKGTLLGEIGLFTPDGRRTMTVRCKTDIETAVIDYDRFKELYFANPQFGFQVLHMVVARLQIGGGLARPGAVT